MADQPNDPLGFRSFFGGAIEAISDNLYKSYIDSLKAGKRIYLSDKPGSLESKMQAFYDRYQRLRREDFDYIKAQYFGSNPKSPVPPPPNPTPPPPPPLPPPAPSPPPVPPPPFNPTFNPNANQPTWMPPRPAPPPGSGGQPPNNPWPANMGGGGQPPPSYGPFPYQNYTGPGAGSFPRNMQPPLPQAIILPRTRWEQYTHAFGKSYAKQAGYGIASVGRAAQAAFTAAAPEVAIPLAIAKEGLNVLIATVKGMKEFSERILESNKRLAAYNGQIAIAYARLSISDFYRNVNLANRAAPTSENLVKAIDRMRDGFHEYNVLQANLTNNLATFNARLFGNVGEALNPFVAKLNQVLGRDAQSDMFQLVADALTLPFVTAVNQLKDVLKAMGVKFPDPAKAGPVLGPWDNFADNAMRGRLGGPMLPKAGPRPVLGGGPPINFGRGI